MDSLYYFLTFIKISNSIIAINSIQQLTSKLDLIYKQLQISNIYIPLIQQVTSKLNQPHIGMYFI